MGENSLREVNRVLAEHGYKPLAKEKDVQERRWFSDDRVSLLDLTATDKRLLRSLGVNSISKFLNMLELSEINSDLYRTHYPVSDEMTTRLKAARSGLLNDGVQASMNI
jgi:hypothetical protein